MTMLSSLGVLPPTGELLFWIAERMRDLYPVVKPFLDDPEGNLGRIGDLLVWNGKRGQTVLAGLESLYESQSRVEYAVTNIETLQCSMQGMLGGLVNLSIANLGLTALASAYMICRLESLHQRLGLLSEQIQDIKAYLDAQNQGHIRSALDFLASYEDSGDDQDLRHALESSNYAANVYSTLATGEANGVKRLVMLHHSERCLCLALLTEIQCLILAEKLTQARRRIEREQDTVRLVVRAIFDQTLGVNRGPGYYLSPDLRHEIRLKTLTDVYQQARVSGVIANPNIDDAADLFEHVRRDVYKAACLPTNAWDRKRLAHRDQRSQLVASFNYLATAVADAARIESLRIRIEDALTRGYSLREMENELLTDMAKQRDELGEEHPDPILVYAY